MLEKQGKRFIKCIERCLLSYLLTYFYSVIQFPYDWKVVEDHWWVIISNFQGSVLTPKKFLQISLNLRERSEVCRLWQDEDSNRGGIRCALLCRQDAENTVNSPLTDTLASGQLYLRTPFQIPVILPSQTLYLHIPVSGHSLVSGRGHFWKWKLDFSFVYTLS